MCHDQKSRRRPQRRLASKMLSFVLLGLLALDWSFHSDADHSRPQHKKVHYPEESEQRQKKSERGTTLV